MTQTLSGCRVLDLTSVVLGPYCTQILGDLGADVIKLESLEGDSTRYLGPARHPGMSGVFLNLNRNKRSLALDLTHPAARDAVLALAAGADVFVSSLRPQSLARLGLEPEALKGVNARLVVCNVTGYGAAGSRAGQPAYDDVVQALSGLAELSSDAEGRPQYVRTVLADKITGLSAAYAILAALLRRERSGQGALVEVPMYETLTSFLLVEHIGGHAFAPPAGPARYGRVTSPERRPYRTRDGWLSVIVYSDRQWQRFLELVGEPERQADPRFAGFAARLRHIDFLYGFIGEKLAAQDSSWWLERLAALDIPAVPLQTLEELFTERHLAAAGFFAQVEHPSEGALRLAGPPVRFDGKPGPPLRPAPRLGEHSREVLSEAGLDGAAIATLIASGVVKAAEPL